MTKSSVIFIAVAPWLLLACLLMDLSGKQALIDALEGQLDRIDRHDRAMTDAASAKAIVSRLEARASSSPDNQRQ